MKVCKKGVLASLILLINITVYSQTINIHYLGHSAFVLQFDEIHVVTDYGMPNAWKEWGWDSQIHNIGNLIPDIMTYSHLHDDHYDSTRIPAGVWSVLKNGKELDYNGLEIKSIASCEDSFGEFNNMSYLFSYKEYNILHTGDIQSMIANIEIDSIADYFKNNYPSQIDVLIMPIEGKIKYIPQAEIFISLLKPNMVIPTHYWSLEYLDQFVAYLKNQNNAKYNLKITGKASYNISTLNTKEKTQVIVLERSDY